MNSGISLIKQILKSADKRPIYIWGAGNQGRGICRALERYGVSVSGFIDRSPVLVQSGALGYAVISPDRITDLLSAGAKPFIIIAAFFFEKEIADECRRAGLVENEDFIPYSTIKPHDYSVEISGFCNLRCMSCPRAVKDRRRPPEGFMSLEIFGKVLDKIISGEPLVGNIQLYQWGEPLLNPQVSEIISYANSCGIQCAVSSNLNSDKNLREAIAAKPGWFRVSVSGCGENYELTHTGGSWDTFIRNFHKLEQYRSQYNPDMKTEVYYHLYRHNRGDDEKRIRNLCESAGFEFHPVAAYLISLNDVLEYAEGGSLPEPTKKISDMLLLPLEKGLEMARQEKNRECLTLRCIHINWDLSISNCMMYYYPDDNVASTNFLEADLASIVENRKSCSLCRRCRCHALHRYCSVYSTVDITSLD